MMGVDGRGSWTIFRSYRLREGGKVLNVAPRVEMPCQYMATKEEKIVPRQGVEIPQEEFIWGAQCCVS